MRPNYALTIHLDASSITLRPTLAAAMHLADPDHGFRPLANAVDEGNITKIAELIRVAATNRAQAEAFINRLSLLPLWRFLAIVTTPLLEFVCALAGVDPKEPNPPRSQTQTAPRMPYREYHDWLFEVATGWLEWSPSVAWNATPDEIILAHKGLIAKLRAINGGTTQDDEPSESIPTEKVREGLAKLRLLSGRSR